MKLKTVFISFWLLAFGFWFIAAIFPSPSLAWIPEGAGSNPSHTPTTKSYYFNPKQSEYEADLVSNPTNINLAGTVTTMLQYTELFVATELGGYTSQTIQKYGYYKPGAIQIASNLTASLISNPPASTKLYLADLGSSFGLAKPAYAQQGTTGWDTLGGVLSIWKVFRNLAYLVFVLIFIAVGFMIMFRTKINPQTVISVEAAIPNLIITLIIITFSYAIVSLMIDLIWVGIYLAMNIFTSYKLLGNTTDGLTTLKNDLLGKSVIGLGFSGALLGTGASAWGEGIAGAAARAIGETVDSLVVNNPAKGSLLGAVSSGLVYVIIAIAILFSMFKVFFMLLMSYIGLIMAVIFAPFQLLGNAFPGSNALTGWLKGMLANVLVFPATTVMFMLAAALTGATAWGANPSISTGTGALPLLSGGSPDAFKGLIGLGMIMMMPKVLEMIKAALKVEKGAVSPGAALAPLVGAAGIPGQGLQQAMSIAQMKYYLLPHKKDELPYGPTAPPPSSPS